MVRLLAPIIFDEDIPTRFSLSTGSAPWFNNFGSSRDLGAYLRKHRRSISPKGLMTEIRQLDNLNNRTPRNADNATDIAVGGTADGGTGGSGRGWKGWFGKSGKISGDRTDVVCRVGQVAQDDERIFRKGSGGAGGGFLSMGRKGNDYKESMRCSASGGNGKNTGGGWRACWRPMVD